MIKSKVFKNIHVNKYSLFIPIEVFQPFADKKINRVKVKVSHLHKSIDSYAAIKRDKISGDFKMMFSKAKQ